MWRDFDDGGTVYELRNRYGHAPEQGTLDEQLDYTMYELRGSEAGVEQHPQGRDFPGEKAAAVSTFFERPKDTPMRNPDAGASPRGWPRWPPVTTA